jgi:GATA-binding protein
MMAPSKSPETRTEPVPPTARSDEDARGQKRKAEEERPPTIHKPDSDRSQRGHPTGPLPQTSQSVQTPQAPGQAGQPGQPSQAPASSQASNRYSIYGPPNRDSILAGAGSPWSALSHRYQSMTAGRREPSPAHPSPALSATTATPPVKPAAPTAAHIDPPRRPSPDPTNARDRFYPSAMAGYPHYSMGRRELQEHREQLREGKRWLDGMLSRTEKLLSMVENKMALANDSGNINTMQARKDELEYEERERSRQRDMRRIEEEREKDRQDREKRERERVAGMTSFGGLFGRDRPFMGMGPGPQPQNAPKSAAAVEREKSEAERNRDILLASRKVSAISPGEREREKEKERTKEGEEKKSGWNGEPVLGGTALPRRDQGLGRGFGRGLWSFDVRG